MKRWVRQTARSFYVAERSRLQLALGYIKMALGFELKPLRKAKFNNSRHARKTARVEQQLRESAHGDDQDAHEKFQALHDLYTLHL